MADYDPNNLGSTLAYIRQQFGLNVFTIRGRVPALLSDLAPSLNQERIVLTRMCRMGILEGFAQGVQADRAAQKRLGAEAMLRLEQDEPTPPELAAACVNAVAAALDLEVDVNSPAAYTRSGPAAPTGPAAFDPQRCLTQARDPDYQAAQKALAAGKAAEARTLYAKAYQAGNTLAGTKLGISCMRWSDRKPDFGTALKLFTDCAYQGCPLAADWLAECHRMGRGIPKDPEKGRKLFASCREALEDMCVCGDADAQYALGFTLLYGTQCAKDVDRGLVWLDRAAEARHAGARTELAMCYLNGRGRAQNTEKAAAMVSQLAAEPYRPTAYRLGQLYYYGRGVKKDLKLALSLLLPLAELGHADAQLYVGHIYTCQSEENAAFRWYRRSADGGCADAFTPLGSAYFWGHGTPKDYDKAFPCLKAGADQKNPSALYLLHFYYFDKRYGKTVDLERGRKCLEEAAAQGAKLASLALAQYYRSETYGAKDNREYIRWLTLAAEQGSVLAQRLLGRACLHFEDPEVLPPSIPDAIKWLVQALNQKDAGAAVTLASLYASEPVCNPETAKKFLIAAEALMKQPERGPASPRYPEDHCTMGNTYLKLYPKESKKQMQAAFDHLCLAYQSGKEDGAALPLARMYFQEGYDSPGLNMTPLQLLGCLGRSAERTRSGELCALVGDVLCHGFQSGRGVVTANPIAGAKWYSTGVEYGSVPCYCRLAKYCLNSDKTPDFQTLEEQRRMGYYLLMEAHRQGDVDGTRMLGLCYLKGVGVKRNVVEGKRLLREAADKGSEKAALELKRCWL